MTEPASDASQSSVEPVSGESMSEESQSGSSSSATSQFAASDFETSQPTAMGELRATVTRLVSPGGCAWHGVQTHDSLVPFLIEEVAELVEALETQRPADEIAGELGDVLYQVLFHAEIAAQQGEGYDFDRVISVLNEKLIARHPHVFGDRGYMSVEELAAEWEHLKEDAAGSERGARGVLEGIPQGMPTLARSAKIIERLKRAEKLQPGEFLAAAQANATQEDGHEANQLSENERSKQSPAKARLTDDELTDVQLTEEQLGDEMLNLLMRANVAGIDADRALRAATRRLTAESLRDLEE